MKTHPAASEQWAKCVGCPKASKMAVPSPFNVKQSWDTHTVTVHHDHDLTQ